MLLCIDIGNTDIVYGIYEGADWKHVWRTRSLTGQSGAHYESGLRLHFLEIGLRPASISRVVLSSVVPALTATISNTVKELTGQLPVVVGPAVYPELKITIDHPHELGADLIANAVAAYNRYEQNCIIVDFGTALTFTTVSGAGEVLGVAILPGLSTAVKALFSNTAQLPEVPLVLPVSAIGKTTTHAIQAGILLGYEGLVRAMIGRIRTELGGDCIAVATGGLSSIISTLQNEFVMIDPLLTMDGLRIIGERSLKKSEE